MNEEEDKHDKNCGHEHVPHVLYGSPHVLKNDHRFEALKFELLTISNRIWKLKEAKSLTWGCIDSLKILVVLALEVHIGITIEELIDELGIGLELNVH